jgi:hypothetical protein
MQGLIDEGFFSEKHPELLSAATLAAIFRVEFL